MVPRRHRFIAPVVWALIVGVASVTPLPDVGPPAAGASIPLDLVFHLLGYAVLVTLLVRARVPPWPAIVVATAFGIVVECIQFGLPYRTAALPDAVANLVGATAPFVLIRMRTRIQRRLGIGSRRRTDGKPD